VQAGSAEPTVKETMAAISAGKVPYNSTSVISVGPGASGKTHTRYSITGKGMMAERQSTAGGDQERLLISPVQRKQGQMVAFKVLDNPMELLQRVAWYCQEHKEELEAKASPDALEQMHRLADAHATNSGFDQVCEQANILLLNCA